MLIVANTHTGNEFFGSVLVDPDLHPGPAQFRVAYSNVGGSGTGAVQHREQVTYHDGGRTSQGSATVLGVVLQPMEVQILVPF